MIRVLQEITDWGDLKIANGIYYVNEHGHLVQHNDKVFKTPMKQFSTARRKFKELRVIDNGNSGTPVKGSKGNTYYIKNGKCTCPGFKFRGTCKHLKEAA
jgi:hypothetical protein